MYDTLFEEFINRKVILFRGFYNIEDSPAQTFDEAMLSVLVNLLPSIVEVHWAGSLRWLQLLITRFLPLDRNYNIAHKCISLVQQIATEISNRVNPYHLLLATRYFLTFFMIYIFFYCVIILINKFF